MANSESTIKQLKADLGKAENDESRMLDILKALEPVKMSVALLQSTKIGVAVGKLTRHSNPEVKGKAKEIVQKWRTLVPAKKSSKTAAALKPKSPTTPRLERKESEEQWAREDARLHKLRQTCRSQLASAFKLMLEKGDLTEEEAKKTTPRAVAVDVETALADKYSDNGVPAKEYPSRMLKCVQSLRTNPELAKSVYLGVVAPQEFAVMDAKQLQSSALRKYLDEKREEALATRQTDIIQQHKRLIRKDLGIGGGEFKCLKCGSMETDYYQLQTRSADEPMTTFHNCLKCMFRWRS